MFPALGCSQCRSSALLKFGYVNVHYHDHRGHVMSGVDLQSTAIDKYPVGRTLRCQKARVYV